jgi:hypothetical protein
MIESEQSKKAVTNQFKVELIEMALRKLHVQLASEGELKATLGDLIRLVEAHSTMGQGDTAKEIVVRWVDSSTEVAE